MRDKVLYFLPPQAISKLNLCFLVLSFGISTSSIALDSEELEERVHTDGRNFYMDLEDHPPSRRPDRLRNSTEIEATYNLTCDEKSLDKTQDLYQALRGGMSEPYQGFLEFADCKPCEALTTGFPIDEIPWDLKSHKRREANPYLWLTIEKIRFAAKKDKRRKLVPSLDLMDDYYFDTESFLLNDQGTYIRGRRRWQSWKPWDDPDIETLLVAVKRSTHIDPVTGLKSSSKMDDRTRLRRPPTPEQAYGIVEDVKSGYAPWVKGVNAEHPLRPLESIALLYKELSQGDLLPTIGDHEKVLALEEKAFLRSLRSRFHYIETPLVNVKTLHDSGLPLLAKLIKVASKRRVSASVKEKISEFESKVARLTDLSLVLEMTQDELASLDPDATINVATIKTLIPSDVSRIDESILDIKKRRLVAEASSTIYHELASDFEKLIPHLLKVPENKGKAKKIIKHFRKWQLDFPGNVVFGLSRKTTTDSLYDIHKDLVKDDDDAKKWLKSFNKFGKKKIKNFEKLNLSEFKDLGSILNYFRVNAWVLQVEAAGSAGVGLWFDRARAFYVPGSRRVDESASAFDHLLIDTMDLTFYYDKDAWKGYPKNFENNQNEPNIDNIFDVSIVNEVQIELGKEKIFVERIQDLSTKANAGQATDEELAMLEGAQFVFAQYTQSVSDLAKMKKEIMLDSMQEVSQNSCENWKWEVAKESKGQKAINNIKNRTEMGRD